MKRLTCEMCGSTDIIKQDGVFVCQTCGTKYSVEEAKKMMIEGTVDVSGSTVKVDTSGELENLYQIARRAKNDDNSENAARYYDMILVKDPTSWEASFYVVYFRAMTCTIAQIRSAAISVSNCEESVFTLIQNNVPENEQAAAVKEVVQRSSLIADILANNAESYYDNISYDIKSRYTQEYIDNVCAARDIMYTCGSAIERIFGEKEEIAKWAADAWESGIHIHTKILSYFNDVNENIETMVSYARKIGKYDPDFEKEFVYLSTKSRLESEITALKSTISNTPTDKTNSILVLLAGIAVWIFDVLFIIRFMIEFEDIIFDGVFIFLVAFIGIFGLALFKVGKNMMSVIEQNQKIVTETKNSLGEKETELKSLTK